MSRKANKIVNTLLDEDLTDLLDRTNEACLKNYGQTFCDLLAEGDDVERYMQGVVPPQPSLWDMDTALHSRGFKFFEYAGTPPVLVNRWIYKRGDEFWVVNPMEKENPDNEWFNLQCWRNGVLFCNITNRLREVVKFFDRERRG